MPQKETQSQTRAGLQIEPLYILIALLIVLLTFLLTRKLRRSSNLVLLVGLSESGKTALFTKIVFNKAKKSVTSLTENEASLKDSSLRLVDLPGADRIRPRFWEHYRDKARTVVFVLDSNSFQTKLRGLGEHLYSLLADPIIQKNGIRFLIACNKQDLPDAIGCHEIKKTLERELAAIRGTKKGQLSKTSEEKVEDRLRNLPGDVISLDKLGVELIETSHENADQLIKSIM